MIINGYYSINTESGKGIKAGDNIYIGIKNYDNNNYDNNYYYCNNNNYYCYEGNLIINIITSEIGIEAKGLEISKGNIKITTKGDGIKAFNDNENENCFGNCSCFIKFYDENLNINSEENGLNSNGDIFIFPSGHYIILGGLEKHYHPIMQKGILNIKGATIFVGGSYEGINATTPQFHSSFIKDFNPGTNIKIYDNEENIYIKNMKIKKKLEYIYFSFWK